MQERPRWGDGEEHSRRLETIEERGLILFSFQVIKCLLFANLLNVHSQKMKKNKIFTKKDGKFSYIPVLGMAARCTYVLHASSSSSSSICPAPLSLPPSEKSLCVTHAPPSFPPSSLPFFESLPFLSHSFPPLMEEFFPTPIEKEAAEEGQTV